MADPKYAAGAKTVVDKYQGERVLFVNDTNHFQTADNHGFATAVAEQARAKGVTTMGLEMIPPGQQAIFDAYMRKEITREEFLKIYEDVPMTHMETKEEKRAFYGGLADTMDKGTRIVGLGSYVGIGCDADTEQYLIKAESAYVQIAVGSITFMREHDADIKKDPKAFLETYISHLEKNGELSEKQKESLKSVKDDLADPANAEKLSDPEFLKGLVTSAYHAGHPLHDEADENYGKVKPPNNGGDLAGVRKTVDVKVAENIAKTLAENPGNMVVVYGQLHTVHDKDLDSELRRRGISTMLVDPAHGQWDCSKSIVSNSCTIFEDVLKYMEREAERHGDPNRYRMPDVVNKPGEIIKRPERVNVPDPAYGPG